MLDQDFDGDTLHVLREAVLAHPAVAGMSEGRAVDVMLAVHELAANAVRHGAGSGRLRMQVTAGALHCQVSDAGAARIDGHARGSPAGARDPDGALGGPQPWPCQRGHGLWLVQQVAEQVSAVSGAGGSVVTAVFGLPAAAASPGNRRGPAAAR
jgi:anti-sigma regulatory factor (Ser/Thr protein kinase)